MYYLSGPICKNVMIGSFHDDFAGLLIMPRSRSTCRVYVGNLPSRIHLSDIKHFFRRYSRRFDILMKNGFAFIEFDDYRDADDAVHELNGRDLLGSRVVVEHARGPRRENRGGGGDRRDRRRPWVDKYG